MAVIWGIPTARSTTSDLLQRADFTGDVAAWKLERTTTNVGDAPAKALERTTPGPMTVPQLNGPGLFAVSKQPSVAYLVNGEFWEARVVGIDDRTRIGIRWWRIRASDNSVLGDGILVDPTLSLILPSLALDGTGNVVITCVGVSATQSPGVFWTFVPHAQANGEWSVHIAELRVERRSK